MKPSPDPKDIFLDALEVPAARRDEFIRTACANDAETIEQVRRLLAAHDHAQHFMSDDAGPGRSPSSRP